ncbi:MAG: hypothetical protein H6765_05875 [Candidatus Peribacteria bacterium]|nr:MAG: hypothetical protein H6765_05875 [Candidatus Peribacteria bacterium]
MRILSEFLETNSFYESPSFSKYPFRAAGDVLAFGKHMLYDPSPEGLALSEEIGYMMSVLNARTDLISPADVARFRLAAQSIQITKLECSALDILPPTSLECFCTEKSCQKTLSELLTSSVLN